MCALTRAKGLAFTGKRLRVSEKLWQHVVLGGRVTGEVETGFRA
jgi:hypothetical protein